MLWSYEVVSLSKCQEKPLKTSVCFIKNADFWWLCVYNQKKNQFHTMQFCYFFYSISHSLVILKQHLAVCKRTTSDSTKQKWRISLKLNNFFIKTHTPTTTNHIYMIANAQGWKMQLACHNLFSKGLPVVSGNAIKCVLKGVHSTWKRPDSEHCI